MNSTDPTAAPLPPVDDSPSPDTPERHPPHAAEHHPPAVPEPVTRETHTPAAEIHPANPLPAAEPPVPLESVAPPSLPLPPDVVAQESHAPAKETHGEAAATLPSAAAPVVDRPPPAPALPPQPVPGVPSAPQSHDLSRIAQDFQVRKVQVEAVVQLLDEGNTVPFITRYRKERTGGLDEEMIRRVQARIDSLRSLAERKQTILKSIAGQGRLTDALTAAVLEADHPKRLEDLYLPFKPKKRTLASDAKDKGLEPAALAIWNRDPAAEPLADTLAGLVNPDRGLTTADEVATGVKHVLAELIADSADVRGPLRAFLRDTAVVASTKAEGVPDNKGQEFRDYFNFKEAVRLMPPHRILAVNRGEKEQVIRTRLECDAVAAKHIAFDRLPLADHPHREFLVPAMEDAVDRLLLPSLEREIRKEMTEFAQDHAVGIFARNLRSLLLKAPLGGTRVLAVDPGQRTGCKVAALDETGNLLEEGVVFILPSQKQTDRARRQLERLVRKHQTPVIAIGNGTGCREAEQVVSELIAELSGAKPRPAEPVAAAAVPPVVHHPLVEVPPVPPVEPPPSQGPLAALSDIAHSVVEAVTGVVEGAASIAASVLLPNDPTAEAQTVAAVAAPPPPPAAPPLPPIDLDGLPPPPADLAYVIVNEAGASDYSASPVAKEEFPNLDATARGTVSIGRRLQDPLAEMVKVDPQHVGVGLYQHDVRPKHLKESLEAVIESCVNAVGVDLNTASVPLLRHVSGLNQLAAREIVEYRKKNGPFRTREQLKGVPQVGEARFTQAAGFLKIRNGDDPLDATWVHPESYPIARQVLESVGHAANDLADKAKLADVREKLRTQNPEAIANMHKVGGPTVRDIFDAIARPGRDVREDRPPPIFRKGVLNLEDLKPGMELKGEILNVVDFGAFVDVGLKDSGLIHISQMANRFIKSPYDVVNVGDVVSVWVNAVDGDRRRVALTMIPPGQERQFGKPPAEAIRPPASPQQRPPQPPQPPRPPQPTRQEQRPPVQRQEGPPQQRPGHFPPRPGPGGPPRPPMQRPGSGGSGQPGGFRGPQRPGPGGPPQRSDGPPPQPPEPPRPSRPKAAPKLSTEQKTGKAALNTFAQLAALLGNAPPAPEAPAPEKKKKEKKKDAAAPPPPAGETPPPPPSESAPASPPEPPPTPPTDVPSPS